MSNWRFGLKNLYRLVSWVKFRKYTAIWENTLLSSFFFKTLLISQRSHIARIESSPLLIVVGCTNTNKKKRNKLASCYVVNVIVLKIKVDRKTSEIICVRFVWLWEINEMFFSFLIYSLLLLQKLLKSNKQHFYKVETSNCFAQAQRYIKYWVRFVKLNCVVLLEWWER